jgi:hypothetical protein
MVDEPYIVAHVFSSPWFDYSEKYAVVSCWDETITSQPPSVLLIVTIPVLRAVQNLA